MLSPGLVLVKNFSQNTHLLALKFGNKALCNFYLNSSLNLVLFPSLPDEAFRRSVVEIVFGLLVFVKKNKEIQRKSWSNEPPKLLACIGFLYKTVHEIGRLRKFNRSREIEFNLLIAWIISMKFGTLVQHAPG